MRKFIVFDVDRSMASIGGQAEQQRVFGFPAKAITDGGVDRLIQLMSKLTKLERMPVEDPLAELFGPANAEDVGEPWLHLNDKAKELGVTGMAIDTISKIGYQTRAKIMKENKVKTMSLPLWGVYGDRMNRFINMIPSMTFPLVVTCHIDRDRDENGGPLDIPNIKGSAKNDLSQVFDVVAYTITNKDSRGDVKYVWQVRPDGRRIYAKDRLEVTQATYVEQNLDPILKGYEEQGHNAKILIIGDSGQGKTRSLRTINPIT